MGVHGLWDLLAPVGRRVSVETLAGKRLAIDASIWMIQFMKAMRDEKGEMVRNAHLLGFFRRICKLLFLRTKPVFVFDGGTPALKRRTVIARRRQRENAQTKIRKTAEKLFLNQIKAMRLSNLAENLKEQRGLSNLKGKEVMLDQSDGIEKNDSVKNQQILDEMLAASIMAEECGGFGGTTSTPAAPCGNASASTGAFVEEDEDDDHDEDEEMIMPITDGNVDPSVLASLPPSMQLDLLVQMRERLMAENRQKYQKVKKAPQKFSELQIEAYLKTVAFRREIDEVQKAAAGKGVGGVQTSRIASEANREFIFSSSFSGDKQVLASSGADKFSKKQQLEKKESSSDIANVIADVVAASGSQADVEGGPAAAAEVETYLDDRGRTRIHRRRAMGIRMTRDLQRNIELIKESEHELTIANSKRIEKTELGSAVGPSGGSVCDDGIINDIGDLSCNKYSSQNSPLEAETHKDLLKTESCIKVSFDDDGKPMSMDDDDDAIFTRLAAGSPLPMGSGDTSASDFEWEDGTSVKQSNSSSDRNKVETISSHAEDANKYESDVEWEEGSNIADGILEAQTNYMEDRKENEIRVEWQAPGAKNFREQQISADITKPVSKGSAEEEFALQEAIRMSLSDITVETKSTVSADFGKLSESNMLHSGSHCPRLTSKEGNVFIEIEQPQSFETESDQSVVLAVRDSHAPRTSDKQSVSAVDDVPKPILTTFEDDRNLHSQQLNTNIENAEIGNLGNFGSSVPAVTTSGDLSCSLPAPLSDDITNEKFNTLTDDIPVRHGAPTAGLQTSHANIQSNVAEDDVGFVSVLERGDDVQATASHSENISNELLEACLEDELLVLGKEYKDLENEQRKHERNAESVNSEMFVECQELLQMFGLPYIIAPMEAEAQCAFLELAKLVDGVVTDDSDVFLFGAQSVYKNIFDDRKYVETYLLKDIESELGLNTEKLIRMALLLGSDYTEGVSGIGIVNAIEVVNAFPGGDGLLKFREWVESPDPTILGKVGLQSDLSVKKNGSKGTFEDFDNTSEPDEDNETTESRKRKQLFMNKHRNVSKNWHFPASFPSDAVISAYKSPQVDKSAEPFSWGKPDIFSLRRLCSEKFAWGNQKADELLLPVLKEYNKHETQLRLEAFYSFNEKFANIRSKRIRQAVKGITGKRSLADTDDLRDLPKQVKKRGENTSDIEVGQNSSKRLKSKKTDAEEGENRRQINVAKKARRNNTGRSKVKGSNNGKGARRGREKESSASEVDETSTCNLNGSSDEHEHSLQPKNTPLPRSMRRSKRSRKATSYVEKDDESDDLTNSPTRKSFEFQDVLKTDMTKSRSQQEETTDGSEFCGDYLVMGGGFCADEDNSEPKSDPACQDVLTTDMTEASRPQEGTSDGGELCGEYLVMGGGFCADEDDAKLKSDPTCPVENEGANINNDSEYLEMGGGFCTDDADHLVSQDCGGRTSTGTDNPSEKHKPTDEKQSNIAQTFGVCEPTASLNAFSAIPFLKRKKRKS
ncbi:hypothetical protein vseg_005905 [Gypsophila vaccaria]